MKRILVGLDGSEYSWTAAEYARQVADATGALLRILHVQDSRLLEGPYLADLGGAIGAQPYLALAPRIQAVQTELATRLETAVNEKFADRAEFETHQGLPVTSLVAAAEDADLVVLGKRGEHAQSLPDHLGSSVERVIRRSHRPCLVTPWTYRTIERVAVAYDGSPHSADAVRTALRLLEPMDLTLCLVTVQPPAENADRWRAIQAEGMEIVLGAGADATAALLHGHPDEEIRQYCSDSEIDLLVMGAYGHTRVREFLVGSTTYQSLLRAEIPVFLVR